MSDLSCMDPGNCSGRASVNWPEQLSGSGRHCGIRRSGLRRLQVRYRRHVIGHVLVAMGITALVSSCDAGEKRAVPTSAPAKQAFDPELAEVRRMLQSAAKELDTSEWV